MTKQALPDVAPQAESKQLADAVFNSVADPAGWEPLFEAWESYMIARPAEGEGDVHVDYFNQALRIFASLGRRKREADRHQLILERFGTPAFLCEGGGAILARNDAAETEGAEHISDVLEAGNFEAACRALRTEDDMEIVLSGAGQPGALLSMIEEAESRKRLYIIVMIRPSQMPDSWRRIERKYGLSEVEGLVLRQLVNGLSVDEISEQRAVSVTTTRSQIRALLRKTGAENLVDMIRQTLLLTMQLDCMDAARVALAAQTLEDQPDQRELLLRDGRRMVFHDFGNPVGRPVLFLHALIGGARWPDPLVQAAEAHRWRVLAPLRPGFGGSEALALDDEAFARSLCDDLAALLDYRGIGRVVLIGHLSSAGLAALFAKTYPEHVAGLLTIGHPGLIDQQVLEDLPNPTRTLARSRRYSALGMRMVVRAFMATIDYFGPQRALQHITKGSWRDGALLDDPAMRRVLVQGLEDCTAQGTDAFIRDSYFAISDFGEALRAIPPEIPKRCIIGAEAHQYLAHHAERLAKSVPNYPVEVCEKAGQFVLFQQWPQVERAMQAIWQTGCQSLERD